MNPLLAALFASAYIFIQCYISGTRLAFSLPAYLLIGLAGVLAFFARRYAESKPFRSCLVVTAVFFAYILGRALFSPVEYLARRDIFMVLACLVTYGLTALYLTGRTVRMAIVWMLLALGAVEVVIGLRQFIYGDNFMLFGLLRSGVDPSRASGTFNNPIHFAGYLEAVAPFALAVAFWGTRKIWVKLLAIYLALICYGGVAISGSRGGWISTAVSLLVFLALSLVLIWRTNWPRFTLALGASAAAIVLALIAITTVLRSHAVLEGRLDLLHKIGQIFSGEQSPYDIRTYNWAAAVDQWKVSQWTGTGAGTHLYYGRQFRQPQIQSDPVHAHSDYLELLAEYGLIGAAGMLAFLLIHGCAGLRAQKELARVREQEPYMPSYELALSLGALSALGAYLVHSAMDFNLHLPGNALLFAFIFGLLANPSVPKPGSLQFDDHEEPSTMAWPAWWARLPLPLLSLGLMIAAIPKVLPEWYTERARVLQRDGYDHDAIAAANAGLQLDSKNPYLYYHLGQAFRSRAGKTSAILGKPDLEAAEAAYRNALLLFPQDEMLWIRLGQTLDALGRYQEAGPAYLEAIRLDPRLGTVYAYYANHLKKIGDPQKAQEMWEAAYRATNYIFGFKRPPEDGTMTTYETRPK